MFVIVENEGDENSPTKPNSSTNENLAIDAEEKYGFARGLAELTDEQLIDRYNAQVGNNGWGAARCYYLYCLRKELLKRDFDASAIVCKTGMRLSRKVELKNGVVVIPATA